MLCKNCRLINSWMPWKFLRIRLVKLAFCYSIPAKDTRLVFTAGVPSNSICSRAFSFEMAFKDCNIYD